MQSMDPDTRQRILSRIENARTNISKKEKEFKNWTKAILYHYTDTNDFFSFKVVNGKPGPVCSEEIDKPDIRIRMAADTMIQLMEGKLSGMVAFTTGKVKVKASMSDFAKLKILFSK